MSLEKVFAPILNRLELYSSCEMSRFKPVSPLHLENQIRKQLGRFHPTEIINISENCLHTIKLVEKKGEKIIDPVSTDFLHDTPGTKEYFEYQDYVYKNIQQELKFYKTFLKALIERQRDRENETLIELPKDVQLPKRKGKVSLISRKETSLLFYVLREKKFISGLSHNALSKLIHHLAGHSATKTREDLSPLQIEKILSDEENDYAKSLIDKLYEIIDYIQKKKM